VGKRGEILGVRLFLGGRGETAHLFKALVSYRGRKAAWGAVGGKKSYESSTASGPLANALEMKGRNEK